jgi:hypothetical protein
MAGLFAASRSSKQENIERRPGKVWRRRDNTMTPAPVRWRYRLPQAATNKKGGLGRDRPSSTVP